LVHIWLAGRMLYMPDLGDYSYKDIEAFFSMFHLQQRSLTQDPQEGPMQPANILKFCSSLKFVDNLPIFQLLLAYRRKFEGNFFHFLKCSMRDLFFESHAARKSL